MRETNTKNVSTLGHACLLINQIFVMLGFLKNKCGVYFCVFIVYRTRTILKKGGDHKYVLLFTGISENTLQNNLTTQICESLG